MFKGQFSKLLLAAGLAVAASAAQAVPVQLTWTTTLNSQSNIPGSVIGEALTTIITVDNGGNSLASQTWTASNFVSYRQQGASGWWVESTQINLFNSFNAFSTNGLGAVVSAGNWQDNFPIGNLLTSWSGAELGGWWNNGNNQTTCTDTTSFNCVWADNVQANLQGSSWTAAFGSSSVPEPATLGLVALALVAASRRRARIS